MSMERGRTRPLFLLLGALVGCVGVLAALRRLDAVDVAGRSMAPALLPGDRLLVESITYRRRPPSSGEVVLAPDPRHHARELVKRVAATGAGTLELRGDAPGESTDSRDFGAVPTASVRWRVVCRYWPPRRIGPVASGG